MLWSGASAAGGELDRLLVEIRDLLREGGETVDGSIGRRDTSDAREAPATILGLYDELRVRLQHLDDARVKRLLQRITTNVEVLGRLEHEVSRVREMRARVGRL